MKELQGKAPSMEEIMNRRARAQYAHTQYEDLAADGVCDEGDTACENEMMMWAAAPTDPKKDLATRRKERAQRDKKYEWADQKG